MKEFSMKINCRKAGKLTCIAVAVIGFAGILYWWLAPVIPGFLAERKKKVTITPLVNEAGILKISYESVLQYPYQTVGKPVIWCVQNRGENSVNCGGNENKKITPVSGDEMPLFYGSKHEACKDMLLIIQGVRRQVPVSGKTSTSVEVQYITQM